MKPVSFYITVSDMTASLEFYSKVFGSKPSHVEERYSYFELGNFSFGLLDKKFENRQIIYGNASALCFHVDDIDAEYERLKSIAPVTDSEIMDLPTVRLFQFKDHDGNLIEIFQRK